MGVGETGPLTGSASCQVDTPRVAAFRQRPRIASKKEAVRFRFIKVDLGMLVHARLLSPVLFDLSFSGMPRHGVDGVG